MTKLHQYCMLTWPHKSFTNFGM